LGKITHKDHILFSKSLYYQNNNFLNTTNSFNKNKNLKEVKEYGIKN